LKFRASPSEAEEIKELGDFIEYFLKIFLRYPDIYPEILRMKFIFSGPFWATFSSGFAASVSFNSVFRSKKFSAVPENILKRITAF
jgi:hypothetical protein